jgi:hypothetical protein
MTQMPSKLVDVLSGLETLELPYILFREPSGAHRVLVEGSPEAAVLNKLREVLGPNVAIEMEAGSAQQDAIVATSDSGESGSTIIIEVKHGSSKSPASLLWWMALQEGSKAARGLVHADVKALEIITSDPLPNTDTSR